MSQTTSSPADVLIVGAGPVGLSAALWLAQAGVKVRIVDRLAAPMRQSRAAIIHSRTLEHFERMGIVEDFLSAGVKVHGVNVMGEGNTTLLHPRLDKLPTAYPFMLGLDQSHTEAILARRLAGCGVRVERGTEFLAYDERDAAVSVRLRIASGGLEAASFRYVIGADGAHSAVRAAMKLQLEGETLDSVWITADVKISWERPPDELFAYLGRSGMIFIAPLNDDRWRVILNVSGMTMRDAEKLGLSEIEAIIQDRFGSRIPMYDPVWISPFGINTRLSPAMKKGRVFIAGDASHVHSPVGGQGMNTGIQDAINLSWKLASVLHGNGGEGLLSSYQIERHGNARKLLERVGPATRMADLHSSLSIEVRNHLIRFVGLVGMDNAMAETVSMLNVAYRDSAIVEEGHLGWLSGAPHAGERAPEAWGLQTRSGAHTRLHALWKGDGRFQLLIFGNALAPADLPGFVRVIRIFREGNAGDSVVIDRRGEAHKAYAVGKDGACYLIRPDGIISYRGISSDMSLLIRHLERNFGTE
ncbi:2-polyprenyl-6-methoxyphenol hydroxylase [Terrimicrobium sacchariphilum]|uniref:2-polyprenyl-6-methoxyphenol hydroxylase n=1 Tax=Terrimicrobium sacchariphilum TaxID=690879 RepID=A0A146G836_TERSA|nr:FAD-dependent monooxygenase [Terrimicrobium sacchariphilum]GAT33492.1 2-polyprenyl-6-methoxyphenol hydroxylase [Terrimicrobium sacchariphilum]